MRTKIQNPCKKEPRSLAKFCRDRFQRIKDLVITELRSARETPEQLLKLAVNEAEALAWQTPYPSLFFPTLALEKGNAAADWFARQQTLRGGN